MNKLEAVDPDALRETLVEASDPKAVKRLMIALAYHDSVPVETISERYEIPRSTVYSWLDRFENESIAEAIRDEYRPGRPARLTEQERERLARTLQTHPTEFGFSDESWDPELVQEYIRQQYHVSYSLGHVRRLIQEVNDSE